MLSRQSYRFGKQQIEQQSFDGFNQQKTRSGTMNKTYVVLRCVKTRQMTGKVSPPDVN